MRAALVLLMLAVGLWPGAAMPNAARLDFAGLHVGPGGQLVSRHSLDLDADAFTVEVWLEREEPVPARTNLEILSIRNGGAVAPFLLGRWPSGVLVRLGRDNPEGRPPADRYARVPEPVVPACVAVVGGATGIAVFHDGRPVRRDDGPVGGTSGGTIEGRLVLGSSGRGWPAWAGTIRAVAIHDRALDAATVGRRAANGAAKASVGAMCAYDFADGPATAEAFTMPARIEDPTRRPFGSLAVPRRLTRARLLDLVLNVLYFLPLGWLLGRERRGAWLALGLGLLLSVGIEITQAYVPGRDSTWMDVVANTVGCVVGAWLARGFPRGRDGHV